MFAETPTDQRPRWIQRRFELSQRALTKLARERGKTLRVTKDVDMLGI